MRMCISSIALLVSTALPRQMAAQRPDLGHVDSGQIVRLHTTTEMTVGRLLTPLSHSDSLVRFCRYPGPPCLDSADVRTIPVARVTHLDIRHGSAVRKGAIIGGIVGAVVGTFGGMLAAGLRECSQCASDQVVVAEGILLTGGIGAGIGALFGSASLHWAVGPW